MENPQFTEMDLHCIARLIQSSFQVPKQKKINTYRPFYGCMYCKYAIECAHAVESRGERFHYDKVLKKLEELTGYTCPAINAIFRRRLSANIFSRHPII